MTAGTKDHYVFSVMGICPGLNSANAIAVATSVVMKSDLEKFDVGRFVMTAPLRVEIKKAIRLAGAVSFRLFLGNRSINPACLPKISVLRTFYGSTGFSSLTQRA